MDRRYRRPVASEVDSRVTIFDVAKAAGVSITTVSHVFSGNRRVGAETRDRVQAIAANLGYRPRATAQALAHGRTNTLALQLSITGESLILNPFFTSLLAALSLAAVDRGFSFVYVPPGPGSLGFVEPLLGAGVVDAAVLVDPISNDPFVRAVIERAFPYVSIGRVLGMTSDYWVDNDHHAVCERVLSHLAERGYVRPALLTVPFELSYVVDYSTGFRSAAGSKASIVVARDLTDLAAQEAAAEALASREPPDAFFCIHDRLAVGALLAAAEAGVAVPAELGVVGVGDSLASHTHPGLTSVRVFPERSGAAALDLLDAVLRGAEPELPVLVEAQLVRRESTRRPS
jgi:DNA-binding LacI/PurR family transcriptional regulator